MTDSEKNATDPLPFEDMRIIEPLAGEEGARGRFLAFNTMVECVAYGRPDAARGAIEEACDACRTYERLFSRTLPSSDIGRLNAAAGEAVRIDPRTAEVLRAAKAYCDASEGVFDITVAPMVALWDFKEGIVADEGALRAAAAHVDWRKLDVWAQCGGNWFARLSDPEAAVDLGGIAKGWIADALGAQMMAQGIDGVMINLGGNVLVRGRKPNGRPWRVGIREPRPSAESPRNLDVVELAEGSMVTSGIYERAFERDGVRYHHILDPRTGMPIDTPWASTSVVAERSVDAEGFSTTLLALGPEKAREVAREHPEILQAYFARADGTIELLRP